MSIPHLFRCPISLDLLTDPVTLSTGHTYDRPSIEKWLADGNSTCPVTMQRLHDSSLVPNHTLRHLIHQWLLSCPTDTPDTDTALSLSSLKQALQSPDASAATRIEILKKVRILSTESDIGQSCLIKLGFFHCLLCILLSAEESLAEPALDCLLNLSPLTHCESLNLLKNESRFVSFLLLLDQSNLKIKTGLFNLLEMIAMSAETRELCGIFGQNRPVLRAQVSLLHSRADAKASEAAAGAVSGICSMESNRADAVKEGAVDGLISYLTNSARRSNSRALATLEVLVGLEAGKKAVIKNRNAVRVLVKCVFLRDKEGCEHAVGALLIACCESGKARAEAVNAGVLMQLLLLLQSQCGSKAKAKARTLLKVLRSMWARELGTGMGAANACHFK